MLGTRLPSGVDGLRSPLVKNVDALQVKLDGARAVDAKQRHGPFKIVGGCRAQRPRGSQPVASSIALLEDPPLRSAVALHCPFGPV